MKSILPQVGQALMLPWIRPNQIRLFWIIFFFGTAIASPFVLGQLYKGSLSLLWLLALPLGLALLLYGAYIPIRRKMDALRESIKNYTIRDDCLVVNDNLQSPAIVYIEEESLVIKPLVGKDMRFPIQEIAILQKTSWFNGSWYPGQSGFWLKVPTQSGRIGFAVANGAPWEESLR